MMAPITQTLPPITPITQTQPTTLPAPPKSDTPDDLKTYVIVDCAHLDGIFYQETVKDPAIVSRSLLADTIYEKSAIAAPLLIVLNPDNTPKNAQLAQTLLAIEAENPAAITWLWSALPFDEIFSRLKSLAFETIKAGTPDEERFFLRYYDPNNLKTFLGIFKRKTETSKHLIGIQGWAIWEKDQYRYLDASRETRVAHTGGIKQDALLQQLSIEHYLSELIEYSKEAAPGVLERLGAEKMRHAVKAAVEKAETSFGFTERGSIHLYLGLVWTYGWDFETDPQYSWVMQTKEQNKALRQIEQAVILFNEVQDYRNTAWGERFQHRSACNQQFQTLNIQTLQVRNVEFVPDMLAILHGLFPQKFARSGEKALRQLITQSREKAIKVFGFQKTAHQGLVVILAFLLGHAFDRNPFYDWPKPDYADFAARAEIEKGAEITTGDRKWSPLRFLQRLNPWATPAIPTPPTTPNQAETPDRRGFDENIAAIEMQTFAQCLLDETLKGDTKENDDKQEIQHVQ